MGRFAGAEKNPRPEGQSFRRSEIRGHRENRTSPSPPRFPPPKPARISASAAPLIPAGPWPLLRRGKRRSSRWMIPADYHIGSAARCGEEIAGLGGKAVAKASEDAKAWGRGLPFHTRRTRRSAEGRNRGGVRKAMGEHRNVDEQRTGITAFGRIRGRSSSTSRRFRPLVRENSFKSPDATIRAGRRRERVHQ